MKLSFQKNKRWAKENRVISRKEKEKKIKRGKDKREIHDKLSNQRNENLDVRYLKAIPEIQEGRREERDK